MIAIVTTGVRPVPMLSFSGNTAGAQGYGRAVAGPPRPRLMCRPRRAELPRVLSAGCRRRLGGGAARVARAREVALGEQALLVDGVAVAEDPVDDAPPG